MLFFRAVRFSLRAADVSPQLISRFSRRLMLLLFVVTALR